MLPSEHPDCQHRNLIGLQRASEMAAMGRQITLLYRDGYNVEADQLLDKVTELRAGWEDDARND